MAKSKHKRTPKTVLKLPDLEQSKSADGRTLRGVKTLRVKAEQLASIWLCREWPLVRSKDVQDTASLRKEREGILSQFSRG